MKGHEDLKEEEGERGADWELSCPGCLKMKVQSEWRGMHDGTSHGKMKKALRDEGSARRRREPRVDYFLCVPFFSTGAVGRMVRVLRLDIQGTRVDSWIGKKYDERRQEAARCCGEREMRTELQTQIVQEKHLLRFVPGT